MKYFWVNQKQSFREEWDGGFLWAPQQNDKGRTFWHWDTMKSLAVGDVVLCFVDKSIRAYGIVTKPTIASKKPNSMSSMPWLSNGWLAEVEYHSLSAPIRISKELSRLSHLFPDKYSPYSVSSDRGNQIYLAEISELLGRSILDIAGVNPALIKSSKAQSTLTGDDSTAMTETERETITKIRTKQGPFRTKLIDKYKGCCVLTGLSNQDLLIASHIKPWSKSTGRERLDSNNGLLLATPIDTLFDKFLISFNDNGTIVISKGLSDEARQVFGINSSMRLRVQLNQETKEYLNTHRKYLK